MIGQLTGTVARKKPPELLLDVNGVGYDILCPMTTFYQLPQLGEKAVLITHLSVREDAHTLFGFHDHATRDLFRLLIKVNGVGPKLALTILSGMETDAFKQCVMMGDASTLVSIPGIGKKTAERLVMETHDALSKLGQTQTVEAVANDGNSHVNDALSALIALGYKPNDALRAISQVKAQAESSEQMIKLALQGLSL